VDGPFVTVFKRARPVAAWAAALILVQGVSETQYRDPRGRFSFSYPEIFGTTSPGTNDGFGDRVAAVRFSRFPASLGGEAALTRGFPLVDLQAAGGLYDGITLEIFPEPLRRIVVDQLPRLTASNFCDALARTTHIDVTVRVFASLPPDQRRAIEQTDRLRNVNPRVVQCTVTGDTVRFDKQRTSGQGSPVQHVYGAVRFLTGTFSSFQLIAGGDPPPASTLDAIEAVVRSFKSE
jgi:hypothetical protein